MLHDELLLWHSYSDGHHFLISMHQLYIYM